MSSRVLRPWEPSPHATPIGRRAVLLSGLALPLGLMSSGAAPASALQRARPARTARLTLPAPTGRYRLGTVSLYLVDKSRPDPWVPAIAFRGLVIQIWYPAHAVDGHPRAPYFTPVLARAYEKYAGIPVALNWPVTDAHLGAPVHQREGGWPVVLYSPGLGDERSDTTCLAEELASRGYVVVTIDHIHDSGVVELPDGQVQTTAVPPPPPGDSPQTTKEIDSRAADVSFVLNQLAVISHGGNPDQAHRPLPRGLDGALDLERVGMFGHSDGGSTTAHVMHTAPILGKPHSWVIEGIGTINGLRAVTVERAFINAWFDTYLRHHDSHLLAGPSPASPRSGSCANTYDAKLAEFSGGGWHCPHPAEAGRRDRPPTGGGRGLAGRRTDPHRRRPRHRRPDRDGHRRFQGIHRVARTVHPVAARDRHPRPRHASHRPGHTRADDKNGHAT